MRGNTKLPTGYEKFGGERAPSAWGKKMAGGEEKKPDKKNFLKEPALWQEYSTRVGVKISFTGTEQGDCILEKMFAKTTGANAKRGPNYLGGGWGKSSRGDQKEVLARGQSYRGDPFGKN